MEFLKLFSVLIIFAVIGFAVGSQAVYKKSSAQNPPIPQSANLTLPQDSLTPSPGVELGFENPKELLIPKLDINSAIEFVGNDSLGRMDVPKNADDVAWYKLGYKIGQKGNAVLAGHLDKASGVQAVFYSLKSLREGDLVIVKDANGKVLNFEVVRVQNYPWNGFPIDEVFGASDKPMLNLITCGGVFDKSSLNYSERTVVFTNLKQS